MKERKEERERGEKRARDIRSIFRRHGRRRSIAVDDGTASTRCRPIVRRMETKDNEARKSLNAIGHRSDGETYLARRCSLAEPIKERSLGLSAGLNISGQFTSFNALSLLHLSASYPSSFLSRPFLLPWSVSFSHLTTPTPTPRVHGRETILMRYEKWRIQLINHKKFMTRSALLLLIINMIKTIRRFHEIAKSHATIYFRIHKEKE